MSKYVSMSRDRVYGMLSKLLEIDEGVDVETPLEGKNKEIADLICRLQQDDWTCLRDVRQYYFESAKYDDSFESGEGALEMADIDIDSIRMEMGMVPQKMKDLPDILGNVKEIATEDDLPHIDKILEYAEFLARSDSLNNVQEDMILIFDVMIAASMIAECDNNHTYAYIVLDCVNFMTNGLEFDIESSDKLEDE